MKEKIKKNEIKYTKDSILRSIKFSERRDILDVILENDKEYTLKEVEDKLNEFMEGVV